MLKCDIHRGVTPTKELVLQWGMATGTGNLLESSTSCLPGAASPAVGRDSVLVGTMHAAQEPSPWLLLVQEESDPTK